MTKKIIIAGAGLGGLAAAANLLEEGFDVEVYEQAPALGEVGAGIQLSANATKVLINLGLKEKLEEICVHPQAVKFRLFDTGEVISEFPLGEDHKKKFGAPYYHVHRAELHQMLADKVTSLKADAIHLGVTATGYTEEENKVYLNTADGQKIEGDMLIGADGIKSAIRAQMHGDEPANYTGEVAWRIMIPSEQLPEGYMDHIFTNWVGPDRHMVVYYVSGGKYLNLVGCGEKPEWKEEGWTIKAPWSQLKNDYAGWHEDIQTAIDLADKDACYCWALNNRPKLPFWSTKRVTLLGDSAHPTLPYMAQGAVMAIEDGAVLRRALATDLNVTQALNLYERNRIDRTARIVNESTEHAALYHHKTHEEFREAFAKKDVGEDRGKWLYNYDPVNVELV